ncbi:hypothetical protein [Leptolyngbya sp. BC1307]|uniref:hypothetical protein n=1 Tax=Leptolyngbya sp. BC1307 TaxID=2029589 RepID=UPI001140AAFA|nr:hypothetical protein [Leptolyngbya sp. BC1307]
MTVVPDLSVTLALFLFLAPVVSRLLAWLTFIEQLSLVTRVSFTIVLYGLSAATKAGAIASLPPTH